MLLPEKHIFSALNRDQSDAGVPHASTILFAVKKFWWRRGDRYRSFVLRAPPRLAYFIRGLEERGQSC